MAYSNFTLSKLEADFGITITQAPGIFAGSPSVTPSALLVQTVDENLPLALPNGSEKARSEWILAPLLGEVRRQLDKSISVFSGITFTVDRKRGLDGICDFLLSASPKQLELEAPVLCAVEAKEHNTSLGLPQCIAEMIAAQLFNRQHGREEATIYGVVTTGDTFLFLRLSGTTVEVDLETYALHPLERVLGILVGMFLPC